MTTVNNILFDMLCPEDNTDDEQEDLPYDGDLQSTFQHNCNSQNLEDFFSAENASQSVFTLTSSHLSVCSKEKSNCETQLLCRKINLASLPRKNDTKCTITAKDELLAWDFVSSGRNQHVSKSKISDVLLRHFPKEGFSQSCQLIDSETIPEISFTESFDETIVKTRKVSESERMSSLTVEGKNNVEQELACQSVDKNWDLIQGKVIDKSNNHNCERKVYEEYNPEFVAQKEHIINEELNFISPPKEEYQKHCLETTRSSSNHRYGQRQVHYQLPDFSKIPPKVKIPPKNNTSTPSPVIKKTKSSINLLSKSAIVKDVLQAMNSSEFVTAKNEEEERRMAELDQQLEMLTKQAEAQNHIDHLRFNNKTAPGIKRRDIGLTSELSTVVPITVPVKPTSGFSQSPPSEPQSGRMASSLHLDDVLTQVSVDLPVLQKIGEEPLSQMLKQQTEELKMKVEAFSKCMTQDVLPAQEQRQLLRLLKEQLDQLEQNYLATKEEHCSLRLQNVKDSSTNTVLFDPERRVEGEIFKLGMLLEDIKEQIDKTHNPPFSTFATCSSVTPCESVPSSHSCCSESPTISSINESLQNNTVGVEILKNEKSKENRSQRTYVIPQRVYKQLSQGGRFHPLHQDQPELQNKNAYAKIMNPLEISGLHHYMTSPNEKTVELQYPRPPTSNQSTSDQKNTDGRNLNYWEMRSPSPINPCNTNNQESNTAGDLPYPIDHCFLGGLVNTSKEPNIIIHPRLKMQLSSKQMCSCPSRRSKNTEYRKTTRGKSDCESFSIFLEGKITDLDLSGSDTEDISFVDHLSSSNSGECLEQRLKSHGRWTTGQDKQNHASSQKTDIRSRAHKEPEEFIDRLCDRQNLHIPQTCYSTMYDTIILSPQYLSRRQSHGRRSTSNPRSKLDEDTHAKMLSSTLDHVLQTANSLKKTTEHMMQVVSEDLAKAKIQILPRLAASQDYM